MGNTQGTLAEIPACASPVALEQAARQTGVVFHRVSFEGLNRIQEEAQALAKAEADLDAGNRRIRRQCELIVKLERDGHDTSTARAVLATLEDAQTAMVDHRKLIALQLERLGRSGGDGLN